MAERTRPPFRADIVGSFLRPASVKEARAQFAEGKISREALEEVTNREIARLVPLEKACGLKAVTDGEFPRALWHLDFLESLEGVQKISAEEWSVKFKGVAPKGAQLVFTGKIGFGNHPFLQQFRNLKAIAGEGQLIKFTIPSPSMLHLIPCVRGSRSYQPIERYKDENALFDDIVEAYRDAVLAFYREGCRYLQFDDTSWGEFCDQAKRADYADRGLDLEAIEKRYVDTINRILEVKPADMTITMHICRGNFRSTWFSSGAYTPVAKILFANCRVDGFFLEYDSDRAGGFEPLAEIKDQVVVLGLFTSKFPELEDPEAIKARIAEASKYVPLDQLCISPQCGFSSTEEGNVLTEDDQWKKLKLIRRIADEVWGC